MANVYDEMISDYNKQKTNTQNQINNLAVEKQNTLDAYDKTYNEQLSNYNDLMTQQQNYIDTWETTQKENQQKQFDYETNLINQAKQDAEKQTNAEIGNAYIDYQKGLNQFGGSAETLASQGLTGTGFAKNQDIAMNITYQNRVSTAKSALQKANTDFNNQLLQASLNNDAKLAEFALQGLEKSYLLALQGFEYKTTLQNNRLNYIQSVNDSYFNKTNTLQGRLDSYNSTISSLKMTKHQEDLANQQAASRYYSSRTSGGSGTSQQTFTETPQGKTTTQNKTSAAAFTGLGAGIAAAISNSNSGKVTAKYNPKLSGGKASQWFNNNLGTRSMTLTQVKKLVDSAYNDGIISTNDRKNILAAYGVK